MVFIFTFSTYPGLGERVSQGLFFSGRRPKEAALSFIHGVAQYIFCDYHILKTKEYIDIQKNPARGDS